MAFKRDRKKDVSLLTPTYPFVELRTRYETSENLYRHSVEEVDVSCFIRAYAMPARELHRSSQTVVVGNAALYGLLCLWRLSKG